MQPAHVLVGVVVGALAVWHVVEAWHHGAIFAAWRARLELSDMFFARMLLCPFCLSLWVACAVAPFAANVGVYPAAVQRFGFVVLVAFAIARLANLGNDLSHKWCRTPDRGGLGPGSNSTIGKTDEHPERHSYPVTVTTEPVERDTVPDPEGTAPDLR